MKRTACQPARSCGDGVALVVADFEGEQAVGFEGGVGLGDEAAVDIEAVGAGEEGGGRFVVADLGMEGVAVGGGDVGRVGDEYFVLFSTRFARECSCLTIREPSGFAQKVGFDEVDAVGEVVAGGVGVRRPRGRRGRCRWR